MMTSVAYRERREVTRHVSSIRLRGDVWPLQGDSLQCHQGDVVLLLPALPCKGVQSFYKELNQRLSLSMLSHQRPQTGEAEHLTFWIMSLDQPIAVKEGRFASFQHDLLLLVGHPCHESQRHPPRTQLLGIPTSAQVG